MSHATHQLVCRRRGPRDARYDRLQWADEGRCETFSCKEDVPGADTDEQQ